MRTLCTLAIMIAGAGLIAGVPSRYAQACDDDRYPCPVTVQETANAPAKPAPQPKKKVNPTRTNEEASAKREAAAPANVSKPAMQEQAMQKAAEAGVAALAAVPADDESQGERLVTTAATAWPVSPESEGAGGTTAATVVEAASNPARLIDPNQNDDLNPCCCRDLPAVVDSVPDVALGCSARRGMDHDMDTTPGCNADRYAVERPHRPDIISLS